MCNNLPFRSFAFPFRLIFSRSFTVFSMDRCSIHWVLNKSGYKLVPYFLCPVGQLDTCIVSFWKQCCYKHCICFVALCMGVCIHLFDWMLSGDRVLLIATLFNTLRICQTANRLNVIKNVWGSILLYSHTGVPLAFLSWPSKGIWNGNLLFGVPLLSEAHHLEWERRCISACDFGSSGPESCSWACREAADKGRRTWQSKPLTSRATSQQTPPLCKLTWTFGRCPSEP